MKKKDLILIRKFLQQEKERGREGIFTPSLRSGTKSISTKPPASALSKFKQKVEKCQQCALAQTRKNVVFGEGDEQAKLMFVGEGPGYEEDRQGKPFVGKAGMLLTKILAAIDLKREEVYITNIVKCHPLADPGKQEMRGNDRPPNDREREACLPFLFEQIKIIRPKLICCLGSSASRTLLQKPQESISRLRGKFYNLEINGTKVRIMCTFHPAYLLRNPSSKKPCWEDMKKVRDAYFNKSSE